MARKSSGKKNIKKKPRINLAHPAYSDALIHAKPVINELKKIDDHLKDIEFKVSGIWPKFSKAHRLRDPETWAKLFGLIEDYRKTNPRMFQEVGITEIISIAVNEHLISFLVGLGVQDQPLFNVMRIRLKAELAVNRINQNMDVYKVMLEKGFISKEKYSKFSKVFDDALIKAIVEEKHAREWIDASTNTPMWRESIRKDLESENLRIVSMILKELGLSHEYEKRIVSPVSKTFH